jgi:hypothetical protein
MVADNDVQEQSQTLRQVAAEELADRLKQLADKFSGTGLRPRRVWFGRGHFKRRSPAGFLLDPFGPQLLLPDGRLWHYHSRGNPRGRYFDARVDHAGCMHSPLALGGGRFAFLGAVVHKYSFGYLHRDDHDWSPDSVGLCALSGKGNSPRFVDADEAFDAIARSL